MWNMTRKCNLRCTYCYYPHDNTAIQHTLPAQQITAFLDSTGTQWTVGMTGGEPLLYPGFIDLCRQLTENHRIALDSNLALTQKVRTFAKAVNPAQVNDIYASLHIEERERTRGVQHFIDSVHVLKDAGFVVKVNYVLHPQLEHRYLADVDFFARHDIELAPRPFKGKHNGKIYPRDYSATSKGFFAATPDAGKKMLFSFKGVPCTGGYRFLRMEPDGTIMHCAGDKRILGNIMTQVKLAAAPAPCAMDRCPCRGIDHVVLTPAQKAFLEGLRHDLVSEIQTASNAYKQALQLDHTMAPAANNLGVIALHSSHKEQAQQYFQQALSLAPDNPHYTQNLLTALYRSGQTDTARQLCADFTDNKSLPTRCTQLLPQYYA